MHASVTASRLAAGGSLALALLSCAHAPKEIPAALVDCPQKVSSRPILDDQGQLVRKENDTNGDGRVDETLRFRGGKLESEDLDLDYDGRADYEMKYDERGGLISWRRLPRPSEADAVPEANKGPFVDGAPVLSRLARRTPATADCLHRSEVARYLDGIKTRVYARWSEPDAAAKAVLSFTVDARGELLGVCLRSATIPEAGESAVQALLRAAPFAPMEQADCLAGHRLQGTFTVH